MNKAEQSYRNEKKKKYMECDSSAVTTKAPTTKNTQGCLYRMTYPTNLILTGKKKFPWVIGLKHCTHFLFFFFFQNKTKRCEQACTHTRKYRIQLHDLVHIQSHTYQPPHSDFYINFLIFIFQFTMKHVKKKTEELKKK